MNPTKALVTAATSFLLTFTMPAADFGVGKLLGGKKATELAAPTLAFKVAGAPTDKVEMIFFYGNATKTLITAANQKTDEVIKNLGEQLKVKVASLTAQEQAKAFEEVSAGTLNEQQKTAVGNAWRDLLASNLLAVNAAATAQSLVTVAPGVPDHVQANKLKYGLKAPGYVKDTPGLVKDLQGIVTETPKFLQNNSQMSAGVAKLGKAAGIQQPTAEQNKKGAEEVASKAAGKQVDLTGGTLN